MSKCIEKHAYSILSTRTNLSNSLESNSYLKFLDACIVATIILIFMTSGSNFESIKEGNIPTTLED